MVNHLSFGSVPTTSPEGSRGAEPPPSARWVGGEPGFLDRERGYVVLRIVGWVSGEGPSASGKQLRSFDGKRFTGVVQLCCQDWCRDGHGQVL